MTPRTDSAADWLAAAHVADGVFRLRPDYCVALMVADGIDGGPSDAVSETILVAAERHAKTLLAGRPPEQLSHASQWREAYRSFGAKPQRTRPSVEALLRRVDEGLPRVDRITDIYNAISVSHVLPIGGEDRDRYVGAARLVQAAGSEPFQISQGGIGAVEHPDAGEVIWRDDAGVTCRRWNWRQCTRTHITEATTRAVFILEGLSELGPAGLGDAADALENALHAVSPLAVTARHVIAGPVYT